ncbi:MAG: hypothetical protein AAGE99_06160 [Chlamydiota bacterium]
MKKTDWIEWIKKGAPGHTSWILYRVDTEKKCVTDCYSPTRKAWIPTDEMDAFFIPLISLELRLLSKQDRLRKGATARPGTIGSRHWGPPQVKRGKKVNEPRYDVYTTKWPHDSSNLSGKRIVFYFDEREKQFPFPYWIQARDGAVKFKIRAIDSGTGLSSPYTDIPGRKVSFSYPPVRKNGRLRLTFSSPTDDDKLQLYAIDLTNESKTTHVPFYEQQREKGCFSLSIDEEKLDRLFIKGHRYLWMVKPKDSDDAVESPYIYIH